MSSLKIIKENSSWYKKGLKFKCTECGKCCSGKNGYVFLDDIEIKNIADYLKISKKEFLEKYTRYEFKRVCLIDANQLGDCIFLKNKKCEIYPVRPKQCQSFPWWKNIIKSEESWNEFKDYCEGIDHPDGKHYSYDEIQKNLKDNNDQY